MVMVTTPIAALLRSRKFLLALFALAQSVALHYLNVPENIWQAVNVLIGVVIASIAIEDGAAKQGGRATVTLPGSGADTGTGTTTTQATITSTNTPAETETAGGTTNG